VFDTPSSDFILRRFVKVFFYLKIIKLIFILVIYDNFDVLMVKKNLKKLFYCMFLIIIDVNYKLILYAK
jgi:hypothetical protein